MAAKKLFLITRRDLDFGQRAVQMAHALREFSEQHPEADKAWYATSNTLALLEVADEAALTALLEQARWKGVEAAGFREPDRQNELTAIALGPSGRRLCQGLSLAYADSSCSVCSSRPMAHDARVRDRPRTGSVPPVHEAELLPVRPSHGTEEPGRSEHADDLSGLS